MQLKTDSTRFQILSLDGGGLKGLFSIAFLANWERERNTRIINHFELIAGTSTGGIIALALGLGFSAAEIMDLYLSKGEIIFPPSIFGEARHWMDVKYSNEGLRKVLEDFLSNRKLGDSQTRLLIPAYDPKFKGIHIFKTCHHRRLQNDYKELAVHVALATSAAPTYFTPHVKDSGLELLDGGVWANNPVMLAVAEGLGYLEQKQNNIAALRIGTTDEIYSIENIKTAGGKVEMAGPIINFMMRGQSQSASGMVNHILGKRYHEINPVAVAGDFELDKLSHQLIELADAEWRHQSAELLDKGFFDHTATPYKPIYTI